MPQMGFFDLSDRYASLDAKKDPLVKINAVVDGTRSGLCWRGSGASRARRANPAPGARGVDVVLMFKALVLSVLYNLSDDQNEYQVRDRLSARTVPRAGGPGA